MISLKSKLVTEYSRANYVLVLLKLFGHSLVAITHTISSSKLGTHWKCRFSESVNGATRQKISVASFHHLSTDEALRQHSHESALLQQNRRRVSHSLFPDLCPAVDPDDPASSDWDPTLPAEHWQSTSSLRLREEGDYG